MADSAAIKSAMEALANQFNLKIVEEEKKDEKEEDAPADGTPGSDTPKTDASEKDSVLKDASVGSVNNIKDLYLGRPDSQGRAQWVDKYPEDVEEAGETEETAKYAFIARKKKCFSGRKKFDIHSVIVNSPAVKKVLEKVFEKYPGVTCTLDRLVFWSPFKPFVHRWAEFKLAMETEKDENTKNHLQLLHKLLQEELKDTIKTLEDYIDNGVTTFDHLWAIFQPKCIVYSRTGGLPNCQGFNSGDYGKDRCGKYFQLTLEPIGWNGTAFNRGCEYAKIYEFQGTRPIKDLSACPLHLHPEKEQIRVNLVKRGRKYEQFAGYHYKALVFLRWLQFLLISHFHRYEGIGLSWDADGTQIPVTVSTSISP